MYEPAVLKRLDVRRIDPDRRTVILGGLPSVAELLVNEAEVVAGRAVARIEANSGRVVRACASVVARPVLGRTARGDHTGSIVGDLTSK